MPGFWTCASKLQKAGKPAGFALGNARGDGNGFANWVLWSHNASLLDEEGNVAINSKETIAALNWVKELYPTFIAGTPSWNDVSNNRAYSVAGNLADRQRRLAVFLAEERSGDHGDRRGQRASVAAEGPGQDLADGGPDAERDGVQAQPVSQRRKGIPAVHAGKGPVRAVAQRQLRLLVAAACRLCRRRGLVRAIPRSRSSRTP